MKTQEQLNEQYDSIMNDFRQKFTIEFMMKYETYSLNESARETLERAFHSFSSHFNENNQQIYLKPFVKLNEFSKSRSFKTSNDNDLNLAIENCFTRCPDTFWQTPEGKEAIDKTSRTLIHGIFNALVHPKNPDDIVSINKTFTEKFNTFKKLLLENHILNSDEKYKIFQNFLNESKNIFDPVYLSKEGEQKNIMMKAKENFKNIFDNNQDFRDTIFKFQESPHLIDEFEKDFAYKEKKRLEKEGQTHYRP